jgi:hypothetical protein
LHWRWHLFAGPRQWIERPWREGWYGSGADYNFNPVLGWGDNPGASAQELASMLAQFDPHGLAQALGRDDDHTAWFSLVCDALLPDYAFSLGWGQSKQMPEHLPVIPVRRGVPAYSGPPLPWPPGWLHLWKMSHAQYQRYATPAGSELPLGPGAGESASGTKSTPQD